MISANESRGASRPNNAMIAIHRFVQSQTEAGMDNQST
jgi:hypothetical protein